MKNHSKPPAICPSCGADVPPNAAACPECGSDENTGWNEENTRYDGLDLPDNEFGYRSFLEKEFGSRSGHRRRGLIWAIIAAFLIILLSAILLGILR